MEREKGINATVKDYPHKGEEISKQFLTNKLKSIRIKVQAIKLLIQGDTVDTDVSFCCILNFVRAYGEALQPLSQQLHVSAQPRRVMNQMMMLMQLMNRSF